MYNNKLVGFMEGYLSKTAGYESEAEEDYDRTEEPKKEPKKGGLSIWQKLALLGGGAGLGIVGGAAAGHYAKKYPRELAGIERQLRGATEKFLSAGPEDRTYTPWIPTGSDGKSQYCEMATPHTDAVITAGRNAGNNIKNFVKKLIVGK